MTTLEILKKYNVQPKKSFGQNFLIDEKFLDQIAAQTNLSKGDIVFEIGAGIGNLSQRLIPLAKKIFLIESDRSMQAILTDRFKDQSNVTLVFEDALKVNFSSLAQGQYSVMGNIPYSITGKIFRSLLTQPVIPNKIFFLLQQEVAERIIAKPPHMNMLALSLQLAGEVEYLMTIKKDSFKPAPKVDSGLIMWLKKEKSNPQAQQILMIAKHGFAQKRKKLSNSLSAGLQKSTKEIENWLKKAKIDLNSRAQELNISDWIRLNEAYHIDK